MENGVTNRKSWKISATRLRLAPLCSRRGYPIYSDTPLAAQPRLQPRFGCKIHQLKGKTTQHRGLVHDIPGLFAFKRPIPLYTIFPHPQCLYMINER